MNPPSWVCHKPDSKLAQERQYRAGKLLTLKRSMFCNKIVNGLRRSVRVITGPL